MYCRNCNAYQDDGSRFCSQCGADLSAQQRADESTQQPYQQTYRQAYYGAQPQGELSRPLTIALPVVALILGILFFDVIGILLGAFALSNFNRYTAALNAGDFSGAEAFKQKSRRLAVAGISVSVVLFVLAIFAFVAFGVFFLVSESGGGDPLVQFNYGDFTTSPFDLPAMLSALI